MTPEHRKKLTPTLLLAGVLTYLFAMQGAGWLVYFLIFALLILIPYRIAYAIMTPDMRQLQIARIALWLGAVSLIFAVHYVLAERLRHNADEILAQINAYSASHGRCAANIKELGITREEMTEKLGYSDYRCEDGKQAFFYGASFVIFSSYHYDFNHHEWHYITG